MNSRDPFSARTIPLQHQGRCTDRLTTVLLTAYEQLHRWQQQHQSTDNEQLSSLITGNVGNCRSRRRFAVPDGLLDGLNPECNLRLYDGCPASKQ